MTHAPVPAQASGNRIQWIDAAKGLGIILIVIGHIYSVAEPSAFYVFIYAFHVPLFFFLSGWTFKPGSEPFQGFFLKKARTLLVPYFCYAMLGFLFYLAGFLAARQMHLQIEQFNYGLLPPLIGVFYGSLGDGHLVNTPVWFVIALFCTVIIGYGVNRLVASDAARMAVVLLLAAAGYEAARFVKLPFSLSSALIGLVFFQAGYWFSRQRAKAPMPPLLQAALFILLLVVSLLSQVNGFVTVAEARLGHPALFLLFAFGGTFLVILLVQGLGKGARWLAWIGQYSLSIMLIHMLVIKSVKVLLVATLSLSLQAIDHNVALGLLVLAVTAALLVPTVYVMERFLPFSLGKAVPVRALVPVGERP